VTDLSSRFRASVGLEQSEPATMVFLARLVDDRLTEVRTDRWASERTLDAIGAPLFRSAGVGQETVVAQRGDVLLHVMLYSGYVHAQAAAVDAEAARAALEELRALLPAPEPVARHDVPVTFWTYTPNGPMPSVRPIAVPEWHEIEANYAAQTRAGLEAIMRGFRPAHGGQLVLWHGEAGTGKTFALRALAWEWREWCQLHYIVDPDTFFGQRADYLMAVLTQPDELAMGLSMMRAVHGFGPAVWTGQYAVAHAEGPDEDDGEDAEGGAPPKHWRLLVLEDTGELLTPDARSLIGQGLSRFLNVVDGLIGQGLRVLVLVTTNEELRRLHPAVARPGRCAADIEFAPLSAEESAAWLRGRGVEAQPSGRGVLASLYAQLEGLDPNEPRPSVGFAG
jgi:hypothetical protein